ncbi:MAG: peptidylprolyl isomerase [candidate division NC10 bacterium]|nr:peptidylprolyl isomerase [candidate division NC10 bacterium]
MRRLARIVTLTAAVGLPLLPAPAGSVPIERVVAVVNEEIITLTELMEERRAAAGRLQSAGAPPLRATADPQERQILEELIERRLLLQEAARGGVRVDAAEVKAAIEDLKAQNKLADEAALEAAVGREGLTLSQFRRRLQDQLAIGKLLARKVRGSIILTDEELEAYYRAHPQEFRLTGQVQLRHLLIAVPKADDPEAEAAAASRVSEVLTALMAGAPFAAVAARYSDAPTAAQGGELGVLRQGELAPELERVAFALLPGEMSTPIRTAAGYNILLVEAREAPVLPFAQARDGIRDQLFRQRAQKRFQEYLTDLRQKAYVEIKLP